MGLAIAPPFSASITTTVNHTQVCRVLLPLSASSLLLPTSRRRGLRIWRSSSRSLQKKARGLIRIQVQVEDNASEACELVNGAELTIGDGSDAVHAFLFQAVKNNNGTGILLLSDIFGFQDSSTRDFTYHTACNGYKYASLCPSRSVLVPDLFRGNPWRPDQPRSMFDQWLATQDTERVAKDIDTSTKWMVDEFLTAGVSKNLGIIGFCYGGGRVIEVLARDHNSCFGTGVSFYGTRMDKSAARGVKVPILFIAGDNDPLCPVDALLDLVQIIGNTSKAVVFEGRGHGFAHRPQSNKEDSNAEEAFLAMRNWFNDLLVSSS